MTPDIVVDIGNSRMKWGLVQSRNIVEMVALPSDDPIAWKRQAELWATNERSRWTLAGVAPRVLVRFADWLGSRCRTENIAILTNDLLLETQDGDKLHFSTAVDEPDRIGIDRLLTSLAALDRTLKPASAIAINVGTAMTIDFVEPDGTHVGGVIVPGPRMMARSLHEFTAKLPLIDVEPILPKRTWGTNTVEAIELGIANAILGAADELVWDWATECDVPPWVFVTGGDADYFRGYVFTAEVECMEIVPHLTLEGIRIAAEALP